MRKKSQGLVVGLLIGAISMGGVVYAKTSTEYIEVTYDNIKVYKDNTLCQLKDPSGRTVEPFIYNGTTYMPVRGAAELANMEVSWDSSTKSIYLWDNMTAIGTYLLEVCPPHEKSFDCRTYIASTSQSPEGQTFEMSGTKYTNGLVMKYKKEYALFNLGSKYSTLDCTVGHVSSSQNPKSVYFIVDGKTVKEVKLKPEAPPQTISIPLSYGVQLKILAADSNSGQIGIGNMTVE